MPSGTEASRREILAGGGALIGAAMLAEEAQAASDNSITGMDGLKLSAAIKSKKVSCVEVMTAYLDHIGRVNPKVNAIVSLQPRDVLLAEAKAKDADLAAGRYAGFLHGFPLAPKDLTAARGIVFTDGSPLFKDRVAPEDSLVVARMRAAGAIMIGKTNAPEFGMGSQTYNQVFGTTLNAYDQRLTSGGSSGGASVAIATRMLPVTDGSDNCGSLRNPAGWNNIYGFRPTFGRVPSGGFLFDTSVTGPMARNVPDLARLLSVQAGPELKEPLSIDEDPAIFAGSLAMNVKGARIGWLGDFGSLPTEPGVLDVCRGALKVFDGLGAVVTEAKVPASVEDMWQAYTRLRCWSAANSYGALYDDPAKRGLMKPEAQWEVEQGRKVTGADVPHLLSQRLRWYQAFVSLFETHDFLVAPTAQVFAFDAKTHWPAEIAHTKMDSYLRWMQVCGAITMTGCPALAAPAGFDGQNGSMGGRSMGIQIVGKPRREIDCLKIANAYDAATRWPGKRPSPLA